jgi:starvation-inducible DNA-binding protein
MTTNIGIEELNRQSVTNELSKVLADEFVLYTKTKNAHWNVEGADFYDKHKFFESQFEQLDAIIDSIAERTRSLGHYAPASLKSFLSLTNLSETDQSKNNSAEYIKELLSDHESIIKELRKNIDRFANEFNDLGTSDFITGLMQDHEKMAWFLRSHI